MMSHAITFEHGPDERVVVPVTRASATNEGVPTQVANPSRASWRTFVQAIIPTLAALNIALPLVYSFLIEHAEDLGPLLGPVYGWLTVGVNIGAIAIGLAAKLFAILMANPTVNAWISKYLPFLAPIKPAVH